MVFTSRSRHARSKVFITGALVIISLLVFSCSRSNSNSGEGANSANKGGGSARGGDSAPAIPVTTARAVTQEVPTTIQATGSLTATETSDVASQTSGQVVSTPVNVGAFVHKGDVIARLNEKDARLRLQQARANEQQATAAIRQAE